MLSFKKIFLLCCLLMVSMAANAQYSHPVTIRGSRVFVGEVKLDRMSCAAVFSDINGVDRSQDYLNYRALYKAGLGLTVSGSVLFAGGGLLTGAGCLYLFSGGYLFLLSEIADIIAPGDQSPQDLPYFDIGSTLVTVGAFSCIGGIVLLAGGIPTLSVYKTRLNRLEYDYNQTVTPAVEVTLGYQRHGLGLAINF